MKSVRHLLLACLLLPILGAPLGAQGATEDEIARLRQKIAEARSRAPKGPLPSAEPRPAIVAASAAVKVFKPRPQPPLVAAAAEQSGPAAAQAVASAMLDSVRQEVKRMLAAVEVEVQRLKADAVREARANATASVAEHGSAVPASATPAVAVAKPTPLVSSVTKKAPSHTIQPIFFARTRGESWDWFDQGPAGKYEYAGATIRAGLAGQSAHFGWRAEISVPMLAGLPDDAALPAPVGQLGIGASHFVSSGRKQGVVGILPRQLWVRLGMANKGAAVQLGRFDFNDGAERAPKHKTLAAVRAQRINQRLIGTFGFSHVQRSFDGVHASFDRDGERVTLAAVRPTEGVFAATRAKTLDVDIVYGSWSRDLSFGRSAADLRVFAIYSEDRRTGVKVDNRPLAARQADRASPRVTTLGAHWLQVIPTHLGPVDLLAWGALQRGAWGALDQRSAAFTLEAGLQPAGVRGRPWLRSGLVRASGDKDSADDKHETFFQILPTPRAYARFPFYNMMNSDELFVSLQLQPHAKVTLRGGAHRLRLSEAADLWYAGGGAFEAESFGYAGRPANGFRDLATVADLTAEYRPGRRWAVELYGAAAQGGAVIDRIYPGGGSGRFAYLETRYTW